MELRRKLRRRLFTGVPATSLRNIVCLLCQLTSAFDIDAHFKSGIIPCILLVGLPFHSVRDGLLCDTLGSIVSHLQLNLATPVSHLIIDV